MGGAVSTRGRIPGGGITAAPTQGQATPYNPSGVDWNAPDTGGGGYDADSNQAPTPYQNPSPGQYGNEGAYQGPLAGTPFGGIFGGNHDSSHDPIKGDLDDPSNPNLSSGDVTRLNRKGPGFIGNGLYINDASAFRLPQADQMRQVYQQMVNPNQAAQARDAQYNSVMGTLNGTGPSIAQQQLNQSTQGNIANAYAMSQSGNGGPMAAKLAADRAAAVNQGAAGQGALLRAQEVQGAQGMMGNIRGQDMTGTMGAMAGLNNVNQTMLNARMSQESQQQNAYYGTAGHSVGSQIIGAAGAAGSAALGTLAHGGAIPGGQGNTTDSEKADKVPALLSPGEIVLPRSVAQNEDAPELAKAFVAAIRAKRMKKAA